MYENKLPLSGLTVLNNPVNLDIQIEKRKVKLVDSIAPTANNAWVYKNVAPPSPPSASVLDNYLGPIINVQKGTACTINWINTLSAMSIMMQDMQEDPPINKPPMLPDMQPSVGVVTHLHGAKVNHNADGWPLDPVGYTGNPYGFPTTRTYKYVNDQRAAMLWFHDHAMDNTASQVFAGLAGLYFIRDKSDDDIFALIGSADQEIPLVIQDRNLNCGYKSMNYWAGMPSNSTNPSLSYNRTEFLGESIFVNGRETPFHEVSSSIYRLRILNGSNARTYALALIDPFWWANKSNKSRVWYSDCMHVIGNEAGLINKSVRLKATDYLLLAPGERIDILLDLSGSGSRPTRLSGLPSSLRLVNLAINSAMTDLGPEGIFQTDALSIPAGISPTQPGPQNMYDPTLINALKHSQANVMQFCITKKFIPSPLNTNALDVAALDGILSTYASDEGFAPNGALLDTVPAATLPKRNRLVLLMNDTTGGATVPHPVSGWKDTQMWELDAPKTANTPTWHFPFNVDTTGANPVAGSPSNLQVNYGVHRTTFFQQDPPPVISASYLQYPPVHTPTFTPKAGTYERWYVANVGNMQPLMPTAPGNVVPDMHPFHMHLVNFVVLRRWVLDANGQFILQPAKPLDFDGISRHDTVRVQSNELVELLVYFPKTKKPIKNPIKPSLITPPYTGDYVYHCHLVEHEDMGMMLHFKVIP